MIGLMLRRARLANAPPRFATLALVAEAAGAIKIAQIVNLDIVNLTMGIIGIIFLNEPDVRASYRERLS